MENIEFLRWLFSVSGRARGWICQDLQTRLQVPRICKYPCIHVYLVASSLPTAKERSCIFPIYCSLRSEDTSIDKGISGAACSFAHNSSFSCCRIRSYTVTMALLLQRFCIMLIFLSSNYTALEIYKISRQGAYI